MKYLVGVIFSIIDNTMYIINHNVLRKSSNICLFECYTTLAVIQETKQIHLDNLILYKNVSREGTTIVTTGATPNLSQYNNIIQSKAGPF